jgi:hypothetical protein
MCETGMFSCRCGGRSRGYDDVGVIDIICVDSLSDDLRVGSEKSRT